MSYKRLINERKYSAHTGTTTHPPSQIHPPTPTPTNPHPHPHRERVTCIKCIYIYIYIIPQLKTREQRKDQFCQRILQVRTTFKAFTHNNRGRKEFSSLTSAPLPSLTFSNLAVGLTIQADLKGRQEVSVPLRTLLWINLPSSAVCMCAGITYDVTDGSARGYYHR